MGTKQNPGPFDCYAAAAPDEPMFVLLARDSKAAALVNLWAAMERIELMNTPGFHWPPGSVDKIEQAERVGCDMVDWRLSNAHLDDVAGIRALAEGLAMLADQCGAIVQIEQQPLKPLAMGNTVHAVKVYPRHAERKTRR